MVIEDTVLFEVGHRKVSASCALPALGLPETLGGRVAASDGGSTAERRYTDAAPTTSVAPSGYVKIMQALGRRIGQAVNTVYPIDTGTRGSKLEAQTLKRLRHAHAVFLARVRALKPPKKIAVDQQVLVKGLTAVTDDLGELVTALQRGDLR